MARLTIEAKKLIEDNNDISNRLIAGRIASELNLKVSHTTVGNYKKKITGKKVASLERKTESLEPKPTKKPQISQRRERLRPIEDLRAILEVDISLEVLHKLIDKQETAAAKFLFKKFNPGGKDPDYNRRNRNKIVYVFDFSIEFYRDIVLKILKQKGVQLMIKGENKR